jgi:hypothetical protein
MPDVKAGAGTKEINMSTVIRSTIFAAAVLAGLSAANARYYDLEENGRIPSQYDLNNPADVKSFWEDQNSRNGN